MNFAWLTRTKRECNTSSHDFPTQTHSTINYHEFKIGFQVGICSDFNPLHSDRRNKCCGHFFFFPKIENLQVDIFYPSNFYSFYLKIKFNK